MQEVSPHTRYPGYLLLRCAGISPDLAIRLEKSGVSTARAWLAMQANHDLWLAMGHEQPQVRALGELANNHLD